MISDSLANPNPPPQSLNRTSSNGSIQTNTPSTSLISKGNAHLSVLDKIKAPISNIWNRCFGGESAIMTGKKISPTSQVPDDDDDDDVESLSGFLKQTSVNSESSGEEIEEDESDDDDTDDVLVNFDEESLSGTTDPQDFPKIKKKLLLSSNPMVHLNVHIRYDSDNESKEEEV